MSHRGHFDARPGAGDSDSGPAEWQNVRGVWAESSCCCSDPLTRISTLQFLVISDFMAK